MNPLDKWLGGAAIFGVLAACWGRLRTFFSWGISLLIVRVRVEGDAGTALAYYCWKNFKRSPFGERRYGAFTDFVKPVDRYQVVGYEWAGLSPLVFWKGWRVLILGMDNGKMGDGHALGLSTTATFLRGSWDIDGLVSEAIDLLNEQRHKGNRASRYEVTKRFGHGSMRNARFGGQGSDSLEKGEPLQAYMDPNNVTPDKRPVKWSWEDLGQETGGEDPWEGLSFPPEVLEVRDEVKRWLDSEKWYKDKRIPWRFGVGFYGGPGTGKSSFIRALAQDLDLPVVSFDLASFSNEDFVREWKRLLNKVPCVALLEDVDTVFHGRENVLGEDGGGLTFDCLLNCLSGVETANGVLVCITTNRVDCLDEALGRPNDNGVSSRPGRVDRVVELPVMDEDCRRRLARRILSDCPERVEGCVQNGEGETGAQFSDRCAKIALAEFWGRKYHLNGEVVRK